MRCNFHGLILIFIDHFYDTIIVFVRLGFYCRLDASTIWQSNNMWVTNGTASGSLCRRPLGLVCAVHQPPQLSGTPAAFGVQLWNIYGIWYRGKLNSHSRDQRFQMWTEVVWTRLYLEGNYFLSLWKRFNVNSKQRVYIKCHRGNRRGFKS